MRHHVESAPLALGRVIKRRWYWFIPGIIASFLVPAVVSERVAEPPPVVEAAPCTGTPLNIYLCTRGRMYDLIRAVTATRTATESQISQRCMNQWVNNGWQSGQSDWARSLWYMVRCW